MHEHAAPFGEHFRNLGVQLRELGRFQAARECFERAIAIDPLDGRAHRYLIEMQDAGQPDLIAHVETLRRLLVDDRIDAADRIEMHFALGDAFDRLGAYDDAFAQLRRGNAMRRQMLAYDEERERAHFALLQQMFDRTILQLASAGPRDARPVFVIGMPRSGTTLVESLLAPHPQVRALGELTAFERAFSAIDPISASPRDHDRFLAQLRAAVRGVGERYVREIDTLAGASLRTVDKMPANFRFAVPIHAALPSAKIIHVRRDPLDTCFSCYATNFFEGQAFAYDVAELARYYALYESHMEYVRRLLPSGVMLEIEYEQLVADTEAAARTILAHCDLDWDTRVLSYWQHERPVRTASVMQVRRPIYRSSIARARRYPEFCAEFTTARQGL